MKSLIDWFLGKPCSLYATHRHEPLARFGKTPVSECQHPTCEDTRRFSSIADTINANQAELQVRLTELAENKKQNLVTLREDCIKIGMRMQKEKMYKTLVTARQLLVDQLIPAGISVPRIKPFIEWYENQRDALNAARQDINTYSVCTTIIELDAVLAEVQQKVE